MKISDAVYTLINPDHFIQFLHICKRSRNRRNATMIAQIITLEYNIGSIPFLKPLFRFKCLAQDIAVDNSCGKSVQIIVQMCIRDSLYTRLYYA